jgi:hypothetical protein
MYLVPIGSGLGEIRGLIFLRGCLPWFHGTRLRDTFHGTYGKYRAVTMLRGLKMAPIMSLEEPRPRGTVLGERTDRLRIREVDHFFRCKACSGWIDARDYVRVEDHEVAPGARSSAIGCTVDQRGHVVPANRGTRIV